MALIVKKFGGTSLATSSHITHLAKQIRKDVDNGDSIVVIVSAMSSTTDNLITMASKICNNPETRELDMLLTTGERISMSLFSMALNSFNIKSCSFTGSQVGIITDDNHNNARIIEIRGNRLKDTIKNGIVPVIAGFQGISEKKEITTLGRGGSDTTAVAIATFLEADECEIYTDVDSVLTADPRIIPNAKNIKEISYNEMLEMASLGSAVIHPRAVALAKKFNIKLRVKSSFNEGEGTMISDDSSMEGFIVRGISHKEDLTAISLKTKIDINTLLNEIYKNNIKIKFFVNKNHDSITFIIDSDKISIALTALEKITESVKVNNDIAAISIIGIGLNNNMNINKKILDITDKYAKEIETIFFNEFSLTIISGKSIMSKLITKFSKAFNLE